MAVADSIPSNTAMRSVLFQLLRQCNYRCTHCSQNAPHVSEQDLRPVALASVQQRLDALCAVGVQRVRFTGGEPLLHPGIHAIVRHASGLGMDASVITNGSLLRPHAQSLAEAGIRSVWISLYGTHTAAYEVVAGRAAPVDSLREAVITLAPQGIQVGVYCPIQLEALDKDFSLLDTLAFAGAKEVRFIQFMEQGRLVSGPSASAQGAAQAGLRHIRAFRNRFSGVRVRVSVCSGQAPMFRAEGWQLPSFTGCWAGEPDSWAITDEGAVKPCCLMLTDDRPGVVHTARSAIQQRLRYIPIASVSHRADLAPGVSCPAMPTYRSESADTFVCPLVYATT
jgi:molybdenum cofactor biosynthesis enzyme MoaA